MRVVPPFRCFGCDKTFFTRHDIYNSNKCNVVAEAMALVCVVCKLHYVSILRDGKQEVQESSKRCYYMLRDLILAQQGDIEEVLRKSAEIAAEKVENEPIIVADNDPVVDTPKPKANRSRARRMKEQAEK